MNRTCIVVADGGLACFYGVEDPDLKTLGKSVIGRVRAETNTGREAGPAHPMEEQRERHGVEPERRFAQEIARQTCEITNGWKEGTVVLVAEPRLLGLMREPLRKALHRGIELKELARDYTLLTPAELYDRLALNSIVPPRRD